MAKGEAQSESVISLVAGEFIICWRVLTLVISDVLLRRGAGDAELSIRPAPEVDQLAAFRAEGPVGVVSPFSRFPTGGAFHGLRIAEGGSGRKSPMPCVQMQVKNNQRTGWH